MKLVATIEQFPDSRLPSPADALPSECRYLKDLDAPEELVEAIQFACKQVGARQGRDKRRIEEDLKLQFHFGGKHVAYLPTDQGRVVVAVGPNGH